MRIYVKLFFGGACVSVLGILTASCASTGCEGPGTCAPSGVGDADGGGGGGEGGADVVAPPGCDLTKSPKDSPACVDDAVGVFVSPTGDDGAAGNKGAPVKSIAKGVELAASRGLPRVYVCDGTYAESIALAKSVSIYGGLSCAEAAPPSPRRVRSNGTARLLSTRTGRADSRYRRRDVPRRASPFQRRRSAHALARARARSPCAGAN